LSKTAKSFSLDSPKNIITAQSRRSEEKDFAVLDKTDRNKEHLQSKEDGTGINYDSLV
jgi:hypothetical protein